MDIRLQRKLAFNNKYLELILFITEQCNFRCKYCYEDFSMGRMQPDVITGVKNFILNKSKELDILKISWFGGEPLIVKHLVYDLSDYINNIAMNNNIKYIGTMTTNGYLLSSVVTQTLNTLGVTSFQISLDGIKDDHDKTRLRLDQAGTFDRIWQNLIDLKHTELDFEIILRIHVHIDNYANIKNLLGMIINNFSGDSRFKIFIKGIFGWRGADIDVKRLVAKKDFYQKMDELKKYVEDKIQLAHNNQTRTMCYAAMANSLAIRANGNIAKCTVALYDQRNNIGKINIDGSLDINNDIYNKWLRGLVNNDQAALACPLYKLGVTV